jgi:RNA polymerase primary sigma factor
VFFMPQSAPKTSTAAAATESKSSAAKGHASHTRLRAVRPHQLLPQAEQGLRARRAPPARADRVDRVDVDAMYLAEMARSQVLTPEQEVQIAERIVGAERALIEALVRAPSGSRALRELADRLDSGNVDVRTILLNPDQAGLDLDRVESVIRGALAAAGSSDAERQRRVVDALAATRLHRDVVASTVAAIAESARASREDAQAVIAVARAEEALKEGKERLVVGNLRLVVLFARKYVGRGVALLDLVQEGNLGLMRAADKFDHKRGFRFSTYAAWWIKQALQRALLDRTLRLPVHVADDRRRVARIRGAFVARNRRDPTVKEIAALAGLTAERVEIILTLPAQPASLDTPIGDDGDSTLSDLVAADLLLPDAEASLRALGTHLESLLTALSPREQQVLRMRFGLGGTREYTLEEVGRVLDLTRERIRQIERAALDKLRAREGRVELRSYLDR